MHSAILALLLAATGATLRAETPSITLDTLRDVEKQIESVLPNVTTATVAVRFASSGGAGSGVVVNKEGLVLTAGHVSGAPGRGAEIILSDGRTFRGRTLGRNGVEDYGMIQIEFAQDDKDRTLPVVELGNSSALKAGMWVLALGHPGGYRADRPAVLRVGRVVRQGVFIQTDAVLVGGDSGGPLFALDGKLIGIHSRIGSANHDNRHVPIDKFKATWDRLAAGEDWNPISDQNTWVRNAPWLGVGLEDDPAGARITLVDQAGPALEAGIVPGDVIVSFNNIKVENVDALRTFVRSAKIGESVELAVLRESGESAKITVKLARRPASQ